MPDVTQILNAIEDGDPSAADELLPLIDDELRKLAAARMAQESPDHTLQATALVHEAYLRLVGSDDTGKGKHWDGRRHFFAAAAEAMRRILVESARRKSGPQAGGLHRRVELSHVEPEISGPGVDLLALNDALEKLEAKDPRGAELVKLRFFVGLTIQQAANTLGVSPSTAKLDWAYAKNWLRAEMVGELPIDQQS